MLRSLDRSLSRQFVSTVVGCKFISDVALRLLSHNYVTPLCKNANNRPFISSAGRRNMGVFKFSDYDGIGFDLDNTLLRYNITNMLQLEYMALSKYLVEKKGYSSKHLYRPLSEKEFDFMQKGLILDFEKGNLLRVCPDGIIRRASHGSRLLKREEIEHDYPNRRWEVSDIFCKDFLVPWNGPLSLKMRALLDYFDAPASVIFARVIDTIDETNGKPSEIYKVWPDILDGMVNMFDRDQFQSDEGVYYPSLKADPGKYIHKCDPETIAWIKRLKENSKTFLITGSNEDFANFTASYAFGNDWRELFDIVVCYAKKPGFFNANRPFYSLKNHREDEIVTSKELKAGGIYNQGNWKELMEFLSRISGVAEPKCVYIGDNLLQDIYTPSTYSNCDTIAIVDEQLSEGMMHHELSHSDEEIINSKFWGSYFGIEDEDGYNDSLWYYVITRYSKICIPKLELLTKNPIDQPLECFDKNDRNPSGYYPAKPLSVPHL